MPMFRDAVGYGSAAVLGYIQGNVQGSSKAIKAYQKASQMKRKRESTVVTTTKRVKTGRAIKKRKPSKRYSKTKPAKISRALSTKIRNIAERVVHGETPMGRYVKNIPYFLATIIGTPGGAQAQVVVNTALFQGGSTVDGTFSVGAYDKVIDAVSVLFGSKATGFYTATGNNNPAGMIIPQFRHKATYEFVNNTHGEQVMVIYECTPKEDTANSAYVNWVAMTLVQKGGSTQPITYLGVRPEHNPQFRDLYKFKKMEFRLKPGRRMRYNLMCYAKHLKLDDWLPVGSSTPTPYRKGFTKELLIITYAAVTVGNPSLGSFPAVTNQLTGGIAYGIGVQFTDEITCKCPENVDNTQSDSNAIAYYNIYDKDISGTAGTIMAPSVSIVAPLQ